MFLFLLLRLRLLVAFSFVLLLVCVGGVECGYCCLLLSAHVFVVAVHVCHADLRVSLFTFLGIFIFIFFCFFLFSGGCHCYSWYANGICTPRTLVGVDMRGYVCLLMCSVRVQTCLPCHVSQVAFPQADRAAHILHHPTIRPTETEEHVMPRLSSSPTHTRPSRHMILIAL